MDDEVFFSDTFLSLRCQGLVRVSFPSIVAAQNDLKPADLRSRRKLTKPGFSFFPPLHPFCHKILKKSGRRQKKKVPFYFSSLPVRPGMAG